MSVLLGSRIRFRLVPTSVTLNDLELRDSPYFALFDISLNSIALYYVTVVEDRFILSAEYRLTFLAKTDPPCSAVSLR